MENKTFDIENIEKLKRVSYVIESQLERFQKLMNYVNEFNNIEFTSEKFYELKEVCKVIFRNVPFMISTIDAAIITRARRNLKELFSHKDQISYNKHLASIQAGRFNQEHESVFYGCLPTFNENGEYINYGNQCPMFEVCKEISTHEGLKFPVFFTLGVWKVTKQLSVLNLCFEDDHLSHNSGISSDVKFFSDAVKAHCSERAFDYIKGVWKYFSNLSRKWENVPFPNYYHILTAFYKAFDEYSKLNKYEDIDGVIYPSAVTQAKGLNIVLRPGAVEKCLELENVEMYTLKSRGLPYAYQSITKTVPVINNRFEFDPEFTKEYNMFTYSW
jgi:hypothetical protein